MKIIPFSDNAIAEAIAVLKSGGVIAHATETCYGLACDLSNIDAVKKVFAIKQRPEQQPISGLFTSVEEAKMYVEWNDRAEELALQYLPGPLTMILPMRHDAPSKLFPVVRDPLSETDSRKTENGKRTIGVRISSSPVAQSLADAFGSPLSTTSANVHGKPNPYSAADIAEQFADQPVQPDLVLDSGTLPQNPPSTVVNLSESDQIHRQGSIKV